MAIELKMKQLSALALSENILPLSGPYSPMDETPSYFNMLD
jgi:hypothetical protein